MISIIKILLILSYMSLRIWEYIYLPLNARSKCPKPFVPRFQFARDRLQRVRATAKGENDRREVSRALILSPFLSSSSLPPDFSGTITSSSLRLMAPRFEDHGQLQLLERDETEEEEDCFEAIDKCEIPSSFVLGEFSSLIFVQIFFRRVFLQIFF